MSSGKSWKCWLLNDTFPQREQLTATKKKKRKIMMYDILIQKKGQHNYFTTCSQASSKNGMNWIFSHHVWCFPRTEMNHDHIRSVMNFIAFQYKPAVRVYSLWNSK
jgi:hypothetical protein